MPGGQKKRKKKTSRSFQFLLPFLRFSILLLTFLELQTIGEGLDFCFDGSKEGMFKEFTTIIVNTCVNDELQSF